MSNNPSEYRAAQVNANYENILARLAADMNGIENPSEETVLALSGHLPKDRVQEIYSFVAYGPGFGVPPKSQPSCENVYRSWSFEAPGLKVKGVTWNLTLSSTPHGFRLRGMAVNHTKPQIRRKGKDIPKGDGYTAAVLVQQHSPGYENMLDPVNPDGTHRWAWGMVRPLRDPSIRMQGEDTQRVEKGDPWGEPVRLGSVLLSFPQGLEQPLLEKDACRITHSNEPILYGEIKGATARITWPSAVCGLCGRALTPTGCHPCGYIYKHNKFDKGGLPIGPRSQTLFESYGWAFQQDPRIARKDHGPID